MQSTDNSYQCIFAKVLHAETRLLTWRYHGKYHFSGECESADFPRDLLVPLLEVIAVATNH